MTKLQRAQTFAELKHRGQKDDSGKSYYEAHCFPVLRILELLTNDEDILCAGVLHDTLEDTDTTYDQLAERFGIRIAKLVHEVTKEEIKGTGYFPRLKSKDAILIKFADRASNLSRMDPWDKKKQKWYLDKSKFWRDESYPIKVAQIEAKKIGHCLCDIGTKCPCEVFEKTGKCRCAKKIK